MTFPRYRARPVRTSAGSTTWTVCDPRGIPVEDIDVMIQNVWPPPSITTFAQRAR